MTIQFLFYFQLLIFGFYNWIYVRYNLIIITLRNVVNNAINKKQFFLRLFLYFNNNITKASIFKIIIILTH